MKNYPVLLSALALATLLSGANVVAFNYPALGNPVTTVAASTLPVNTTASTMTWNAKKFGGEHTGSVKLASGTLDVSGRKLTGGNFVIDMRSITDTDITNAEFNKKLTDHLKSDDFFSVEKHPTATFKITEVAPMAKPKAGEPNYTITGDLTIKGITNAVTFPANVRIAGNKAEAEAKIELDRTKWDIKYRSGLLGTAADKVIYDNFTIDLKLVAGAATPLAEGK
ncbi:polyisoprenoid-binding protein YceI [Pontibacter ummariensis]|uniref:Polyisoprenoid-binding protein YceI n=1 Tax=Pontibacter ummariensis TaxID=1610492 RepID=A0A239FSA3_9BACT|nr:YceI family protein [Pontibacter ummariensis]PRY11968.1 polyisoprenoid-binding protein YceI [Pontibacter ummariensis]SNS59102.1 Polyisoprenoid-binding protein YceI [Pontibacter ummariensis]